ncbi:hypothetical protein FACS189411_08430 [Bacteroidia bacterium]|nr:hypothetical protein FACS189411_08430 [Bacteroidia bacterium]
MDKLKEYRKWIDTLSLHWDDNNSVQPNYFAYNDLEHIFSTVKEYHENCNAYKITGLVIENKGLSVEYSVETENGVINCPAYFLSKS